MIDGGTGYLCRDHHFGPAVAAEGGRIVLDLLKWLTYVRGEAVGISVILAGIVHKSTRHARSCTTYLGLLNHASSL